MQYQLPLNQEYDYGYKSDLRFRLACSFLERWGLVCGQVEREDTAGRAFYDPMPVEQVVERAFLMADLVVAKAEEQGWLASIGESPEDVARFVRSAEEYPSFDAPRRGRQREDATGEPK